MQTGKVMNAYELFDNAPRKRYEFRIDGLTPMIEYAKPADGVIVLTHTEVPRELAGRGIGSRLVEKVLADIDRQGRINLSRRDAILALEAKKAAQQQ